MDIAFAALATVEVELEVGVLRGDVTQVIECSGGNGCAAKIRMKDDAGCIDDRTQRERQRSVQLAFDCLADAAYSKVHGGGVETVARDLGPQAFEHAPGGIGDGNVPLAVHERSQLRTAQKFVEGRQLAEQLGLGHGLHAENYDTRAAVCSVKDRWRHLGRAIGLE